MGYIPDFNYGYNFSIAEVASQAGTTFLVAMGVYLAFFLYSIGAYILSSFGMYTIAMRRGIHHPWLAWVPFGNVWILGSIADQYQYVSLGQVKSRRKVLLGLQITITALTAALYAVAVYMIAQLLFHMGDVTPLETMAGVSLIYILLAVAILVLWVLLVVFRYICLYNLYASCKPGCKVVFLLLSLLLFVAEPILVFACRKKDCGMPPRKEECAPIDPPVFEV